MSVLPSNTVIESGLDLITTGTPYLALYTSNPGPTNTGTEVTGGSYARKAITFSATSGGARTNTAEIRFPGLPASTVTHYGILSASTAGTLRAYGTLSSSMINIAGDEAVFSVGAISVSLGGS